MRETNRRRPAVRLSALLLALGLVLLPGCRPGDEDITTITFVHGWGSTEADHEIMRRIFSDFEAQNPGIRLNMLSLPTENDMIRKTGDMLMVGTVPDVVCLSGKGLDTIYKFMVERGCALDLMPYIQADSAFAANISPINLEYWTTEEGGIYSIADVLILGGGYWYNREIFQRAGIAALPATWEEFAQVCDQIEAWAAGEGNGVHALHLSAEGYAYFADQLLAAGEPPILDNRDGSGLKRLPAVLPTLERIHRYSVEENGRYTYRDETSLFNDGKLAIYVNGVWGAPMISEGLDAAYALLPGDGKQICCESVGTGYILGNTGDAARQDASLRFLRYMLSESVQERILLETQQMPANPNLHIQRYARQLPRFCQAVATVQRAEIKAQIPVQFWSEQQLGVFLEHIFSVLSGELNKQTFFDMMR